MAVRILVAALVATALLPAHPRTAEAWHCPNGGGYYGGFSDVGSSDWFYPYVTAAANAGWMSGWEVWRRSYGFWQREWLFYPNSDETRASWRGALYYAYGSHRDCGTGYITRAYAASELIRDAGLGWVADQMSWWEAEAILSQFPDYRQTPSDVFKDVAVAVKYGIINGVRRSYGVYLEPNSNLTRAQAATILTRAGLARVSTDKTRYHIREVIRVTGQPYASGYYNEYIELYRNDGTRIAAYWGRSVQINASSIGIGRYYVRYRFDNTIGGRTYTWVSAPYVFDVYNNAPTAEVLAPSGTFDTRRPPIRVRVWEDDGDRVRQVHVQVLDSGWNVIWEQYLSTDLGSGQELTLTPDPLWSGTTLYVRARAMDQWWAWGPFGNTLAFSINPAQAEILQPQPGAIVPPRPQLTVRGYAPDGARIRGVWVQVARDPGFGWVVYSRQFAVDAASGEAFTVQVDQDLPAGVTLYARVAVTDGYLRRGWQTEWGAWSAAVSFWVNRPPTVRWLEPADGSILAFDGPLGVRFDATDPDGHRVTEYELEVATDDGFYNVVQSLRNPHPTGGGPVALQLTGLPNGPAFLRVRAADQYGIWSDWAVLRLTLRETRTPVLDRFRILPPGYADSPSVKLDVSARDPASNPVPSGLYYLRVANVPPQGLFVRLPDGWNDATGQERAVREIASWLGAQRLWVYHDPAYPASWWRGDALASSLRAAGWQVMDARALRAAIDQALASGTAAGTVLVMAQDVVPDTVAPALRPDVALVQFMAAGGTVIWAGGDVPFYYQGHAGGWWTVWGTAGMETLLGVRGVADAWGARQVTPTPLGQIAGLPALAVSRAVPKWWPVVPVLEGTDAYGAWILPVGVRAMYGQRPWTDPAYDDTAWAQAVSSGLIGDQPWGPGRGQQRVTQRVSIGLRIDASYNYMDRSVDWYAPQGATIAQVRFRGYTEPGWDYGYLYAFAGGYWQLIDRRSGSWDFWVTLPAGTTAVRLRYTTDSSILYGPVEVPEGDIVQTVTVCPWAVSGGDQTYYPNLRLNAAYNNQDAWSNPWYAPQGATIVRARFRGNTEPGYDYGYMYALVNGAWQLIARRSGSWDQWYDLPAGTTAVQIRYTTDGSILYGPVELPEAVVRVPAACPPDDGAHWIWDRDARSGAPVGTIYLRKKFSVQAPTTARLVVRADDAAEIYLDGVRLPLSPVWWQASEMRVQLSAGEHALAVKATNTGGPAGFVLTLLDPQGRVIVHTDPTWKTTGYRSSDPPPQAYLVGLGDPNATAVLRPLVAATFDAGPDGWTGAYGGVHYWASGGVLTLSNDGAEGCCTGLAALEGGRVRGFKAGETVTVRIRFRVRNLAWGGTYLFHHVYDGGRFWNQDICLSCGAPTDTWVEREFRQPVPPGSTDAQEHWFALGFAANRGAALDVDWIRIEPGDGTGMPWELERGGSGPLQVTSVAFDPNPARSGDTVRADVGVSGTVRSVRLVLPGGQQVLLQQVGPDRWSGTFTAPDIDNTQSVKQALTVTVLARAGALRIVAAQAVDGNGNRSGWAYDGVLLDSPAQTTALLIVWKERQAGAAQPPSPPGSAQSVGGTQPGQAPKVRLVR